MNYIDRLGKNICLANRSLAVFRIFLGIIVLTNLALKLPDLRLFYTDDGILPVYAWEIFYKDEGTWSLHAISGSLTWIYILVFVQAIFAVSFMLGYKTRLSNVLLFILHISLNLRNFLILDGGDCVLVNLLLWSFFLPINKCLSFDSFFEKSKSSEDSCKSYISIVYIAQLIFIYFTSAVLKVGHWETGDALYYALGLDGYNREFTKELLNYPNLLRYSTFYVYYLEKYLWILLFVPIYQKFFRYLTVFLFVSFHFGIIILMDIGLFPFIGIIAWIPLLPGSFWKFFERKKIDSVKVLFKGKPKLIDEMKNFSQVFFGDKVIFVNDGEDKDFKINKFNEQTCQSFVNEILSEFDKLEIIRKLYELKVKKYFKSEKNLDSFKVFSTSKKCALVLLSILLLVLNLHEMKVIKIPAKVQYFSDKIHFQQHWLMFTKVGEYTGWGVAMGVTKNGETLNVINGKKDVWEKPDSVVNYYGGMRWVKFHSIFKERDKQGFKYNQLAKLYLNYLGREWNEIHPDNPLEYVHYFYVYDKIGTNKTFEEYERLLIDSVEILPKEIK